ncbi:DUF3122 domain-containing protein, partial [bacterium]|nr:DUF3122 domain-containing protein [bacterium]
RLGDRSGNSWQLVLFQRVKAGVPESASLRIVGFPGRDTFLHPQPLQVRSRQIEFLAPDMFAAQAPAANVGQYDMQEILPQLSTNNSMELTLPLAGDRPVHLRVPDVVVLEWKLMVQG